MQKNSEAETEKLIAMTVNFRYQFHQLRKEKYIQFLITATDPWQNAPNKKGVCHRAVFLRPTFISTEYQVQSYNLILLLTDSY